MISIFLSLILFTFALLFLPLSLLQLIVTGTVLLVLTALINYHYRAKPEDYEFSNKDYTLSSEFSLSPIEIDSAGRRSYIKRHFENGREFIQFVSTGQGQGMKCRQVPRNMVKYVYDNNPRLLFYVAKGIFYPDLLQSILPCKKAGVIIELHIPDAVAYYQS